VKPQHKACSRASAPQDDRGFLTMNQEASSKRAHLAPTTSSHSNESGAPLSCRHLLPRLKDNDQRPHTLPYECSERSASKRFEMATSLIESQRESHYSLEQHEDALVQLLCVPEENYRIHRERLQAKHRASYLMDRIVDRSSELRDIYRDESGLRKQEIDDIANGGITEFYDRLAKLKDYHRRFPENASRGEEDDRIDFSGLTGPGFIDGQDCEHHSPHLTTLVAFR
jgi:hypothetical protein